MKLEKSEFQSKIGKKLWYLIMENGREAEMELRAGLNKGSRPRTSSPVERKADSYTPPPVQSKPKPKPKAAKPELSDIVQPEASPAPEKRPWELPPEYQNLSLSDAMGYCIRNRSIPVQDQPAVLKLIANVVTGRSTLVTGVSGGGKSYNLNTVLMMVPGDMKDEFADSKQFFNVARKHNGNPER